MQEIKRLEKLSEILVCPECREDIELKNDKYECCGCLKSYPIIQGIPLFVNSINHPEVNEIYIRDKVAGKAITYDKKMIMKMIEPHHYISLMHNKVNNFIGRFNQNHCYVLDIGIGWGWHWLLQNLSTHTIVGIDFSFNSLLISKKLLENNENVILVCSDASSLPFKENCFNGIWSVQTFQHLPPPLFDKAMNEIVRVLKSGGFFEIRWLNDNYILRLAYILVFKKFEKESIGDFYLRRQNVRDLIRLLTKYKDLQGLQGGYDEFLFHPVLKFSHNRGILVKVDNMLSAIPILNRLFANQSIISGKKA